MFLVFYMFLLSFVMQDRMDLMNMVLIKDAVLLASFLPEQRGQCIPSSLFQSAIFAFIHPSTTLFFLAISLVTQHVQQS